MLPTVMIPVFSPMPMLRRFAGGQSCVHLLQDLDLPEGAFARKQGVIRLGQRGAPETHDLVAHVLVQRPVVLEDEVRHRRQVHVEVVDELLRGQAFRERGEPADVGEEHRQLLVHAAELGRAVEVQELVDDTGVHVLAEHVADAPLVPLLEDGPVGNDREEREERPEGGSGEDEDVVLELEDEHEDEEVDDDGAQGDDE